MRGSADTPLFKTPKRQSKPSSRILVIALLTLLLPPLGLICLWRGARCPMRGKILLSIVGLASMTFIFVLILNPSTSLTDELPINYQYAASTAVPSTAPAPETTLAPQTGDGTDLTDENTDGGGDTGLDDGMAPANPAG